MTDLAISWPEPGRYLLAVSGGADSVVLLDLFARESVARGYELVVAHVDHGLRADSAADARFVAEAAARYGLAFVATALNLGRAGEAKARAARYAWLESESVRQHARAIVTAHHQDDLIETSLLNLARGTGRLGLAPMQAGPVVRPLLGVTRTQLRDYATAQGLTWHEDSTNSDITNPRNFLRHRLLPQAPAGWSARYLAAINELAGVNSAIAAELVAYPAVGPWPRRQLVSAGLAVSAELIARAYRHALPAANPGRRQLAELALFAITARPGQRRSLAPDAWLVILHKTVEFQTSNPPKSGIEPV